MFTYLFLALTQQQLKMEDNKLNIRHDILYVINFWNYLTFFHFFRDHLYWLVLKVVSLKHFSYLKGKVAVTYYIKFLRHASDKLDSQKSILKLNECTFENNAQQSGQENQWRPDCFIGQGYLRGVIILSFNWTQLTSRRSSLCYIFTSPC